MPIAVNPTTGDLPTWLKLQPDAMPAPTWCPISHRFLLRTDHRSRRFCHRQIDTFELFEDPTNDVPDGFYDDLDQVWWRLITVPEETMRLLPK